MAFLTTRELLAHIQELGFRASGKLLADLVRRGLVEPPERRRRREGGPGSEGYWPESAVERLESILRLRREGLGYEQIMARLDIRPQGRDIARRLSMTAWLLPAVLERIEKASKESRIPIMGLLELGAQLYYEAPEVVKTDQYENEFRLLSLMGVSRAVEGRELTFNRWFDLAVRYVETLSALRIGRLPDVSEADARVYAYLLLRMLADGDLPPEARQALQMVQEDATQDGEVVGRLTTYRGFLRILTPLERISEDKERCQRLAKELGAVVLTADGRDFSAADAAKALASVGDWLRERTKDGR